MNFKRHLNEINSDVETLVNIVTKEYRKYDPGNYLYRLLFEQPNGGDHFSEEFLELVYVTLTAWGMRSRWASLTEFEVFRDSIITYEDAIKSLKGFRIESIKKDKIKCILEAQKILYDDLELVPPNKPKLVAFSKTMHFLLPNLFVPMDRKYTLGYFLGYTSFSGNSDREFNLYSSLYLEFLEFSATHPELLGFIDDNWNQTIPKILDNIIIGFMKRNY